MYSYTYAEIALDDEDIRASGASAYYLVNHRTRDMTKLSDRVVDIGHLLVDPINGTEIYNALYLDHYEREAVLHWRDARKIWGLDFAWWLDCVAEGSMIGCSTQVLQEQFGYTEIRGGYPVERGVDNICVVYPEVLPTEVKFCLTSAVRKYMSRTGVAKWFAIPAMIDARAASKRSV